MLRLSVCVSSAPVRLDSSRGWFCLLQRQEQIERYCCDCRGSFAFDDIHATDLYCRWAEVYSVERARVDPRHGPHSRVRTLLRFPAACLWIFHLYLGGF